MLKSLNESLLFHPQTLPKTYNYNFYPHEHTELNIPMSDKTELNALHFKVPNPKGVLLYFHGNAGSLASWGYVAQDFLPLGYDVFIYDYRGYGKSGGSIDGEEQMTADARVLFDRLVAEYGADRVILYGRSVGTGVAVDLARALGGSGFRMMVLETPFTSLASLARHHYPIFPRSFVKYKFLNDRKLMDVSVPVYLIHGTKDRIVPYSHSEELVKQYPRFKLFTVQGGGHNDLSDYPEFKSALFAIF